MNTLELPIGTRIVATPQQLATLASQTARAARKAREQKKVAAFIAAARDQSKAVEIVRYSNRKLYMIEVSSYITMIELASLIVAGYTPKVYLHKTTADVTEATLQQCLLQLGGLDEASLRALIKRAFVNKQYVPALDGDVTRG